MLDAGHICRNPSHAWHRSGNHPAARTGSDHPRQHKIRLYQTVASKKSLIYLASGATFFDLNRKTISIRLLSSATRSSMGRIKC
eukprot:1909745-Amphidinium_carterae.2